MTTTDAAPPAAPATRPARHLRATTRPSWRRRGDSLLGLVLAALVVGSGLAAWLITVPVVGSGTALVARPNDDTGDQQVLIVFSGDDARGVEAGTEVSVIWGTDSEKVEGTVSEITGPLPGRELAERYELPDTLLGDGDAVVAEARFDPIPGARAGLSGTATAQVGRRPLVQLFVGKGVSR